MKKVVITGADGFVGAATCDYFLDKGVEVLALDISDQPKKLKNRIGLTYKRADVCDSGALYDILEGGGYDTFIHFAWLGSAGEKRKDYKLQLKNAEMTVECLKTASKAGVKRFVCAGSIMEREVAAAVSTQGSKPSTAYIYGMGKLIAHDICKCVAAELGVELVWPMITNAYGAGELSPRFVNTTLRKIINGEKLQFTSGTQNYDFVYIDDVARAFYLIAQNGKPFCEYVIGSSKARPLKEFILEMTDALAGDNKAIFGDVLFTGTDLPLSAFDTTDTERDTGFKAEIPFAEGAKRTYEWLKGI